MILAILNKVVFRIVGQYTVLRFIFEYAHSKLIKLKHYAQKSIF